MKKTLLKEGILSPEDENGGYNENQTRNVEENELWTTKIPREMLESTALEAAQRYVVVIFVSPPSVISYICST